MKLSEEVDLTVTISVCNMGYTDYILGVCGVGGTEKNLLGSQVLMETKMKEVVPPEVCGVPHNQFLQFCARCVSDSCSGTYRGDSGGPVYVLTSDDVPLCLTGLVSYGEGLVSDSGFIRVTHFTDWIYDHKDMKIDGKLASK